MNWKKLALVTAAVVLAGYAGSRLGGSERAGTALAGGGGSDKLIAFSTDGPGIDNNRIVIINPAKQKIMVYRLNGNEMGLIIVRGYEYDQELLWTPPGVPGNGYTYDQVEKSVKEARARAGAGTP